MEQFVQLVRDPRARDLLDRTLQGRGAFRRFKDTLLEFPELRDAWFSSGSTTRACNAGASSGWPMRGWSTTPTRSGRSADHQTPTCPSCRALFDPQAVARPAADDLRHLYGRRLKQVLLFGSWARKDAHPESDIDLLAVLDRVGSVWEELRRMDPILWRHSVDNDTVVTVVPVAEPSIGEARWPLLVRAQREGHLIA